MNRRCRLIASLCLHSPAAEKQADRPPFLVRRRHRCPIASHRAAPHRNPSTCTRSLPAAAFAVMSLQSAHTHLVKTLYRQTLKLQLNWTVDLYESHRGRRNIEAGGTGRRQRGWTSVRPGRCAIAAGRARPAAPAAPLRSAAARSHAHRNVVLVFVSTPAMHRPVHDHFPLVVRAGSPARPPPPLSPARLRSRSFPVSRAVSLMCVCTAAPVPPPHPTPPALLSNSTPRATAMPVVPPSPPCPTLRPLQHRVARAGPCHAQQVRGCSRPQGGGRHQRKGEGGAEVDQGSLAPRPLQ